VASGPADTGNLPGNNGNELQGLALELRNTAQIDPVAQTGPSAFLFYILKNMGISHHVQMEGGALPKGVPTTGLAADTRPVIA
jgi:hypothetical protein